MVVGDLQRFTERSSGHEFNHLVHVVPRKANMSDSGWKTILFF